MFFRRRRRRIDFAQQPSRKRMHASGAKTARARDFAENMVSAKLTCGVGELGFTMTHQLRSLAKELPGFVRSSRPVVLLLRK